MLGDYLVLVDCDCGRLFGCEKINCVVIVGDCLVTDLCRNARVKWNKKEEVRAPKRVIDDAVVVKIQSDNAEVEPRPAGSSQSRPGTVHDRINHMEQYMQSQFTYLNQYQHSMVQYMF